jgi:tetratricopeptide (TPR) repeat protein
MVYYDQGQLEQAIANYDKAIELLPSYANTYYNRAFAHNAQGNPGQAIADFRHYLQLQPDAEDRSQVEAWIAKLEATLGEQP